MKRRRRTQVDKTQTPELLRLKKEWHRLSLLECGERLAALVSQGWSRRALARRLKCSEGIIRRNLRIASLPPQERDAIRAGESAQAVLGRERTEFLARQQERQRVQEQESEKISDRIALDVVRWVEGTRLAAAFVPQLFHEIQMQLNSAEHWSRVDPRFRLPRPLHEAAQVGTVIKRSEPTRKEAEFEPARLALWGARWLARVAPDYGCRARALRKALSTIQKK